MFIAKVLVRIVPAPQHWLLLLFWLSFLSDSVTCAVLVDVIRRFFLCSATSSGPSLLVVVDWSNTLRRRQKTPENPKSQHYTRAVTAALWVASVCSNRNGIIVILINTGDVTASTVDKNVIHSQTNVFEIVIVYHPRWQWHSWYATKAAKPCSSFWTPAPPRNFLLLLPAAVDMVFL